MFRQRPSAPRTSASASGSSLTGREDHHVPTPTATDGVMGHVPQRAEAGEGMHSVGLKDWIRRWPTPTVQDAKNDAGPSQWDRNSDPPNVAVKRAEWRTPTAHDWKNHEASRQVYLSDQVEQPSPSKNGGQLNPTWVEWLMGFPAGWTDCEHLGTPLFRKSLKPSGGASSRTTNGGDE